MAHLRRESLPLLCCALTALAGHGVAAANSVTPARPRAEPCRLPPAHTRARGPAACSPSPTGYARARAPAAAVSAAPAAGLPVGAHGGD